MEIQKSKTNKEILMGDMISLRDAKTEAKALEGSKSKYISDKVFQFNKMWWDNIQMMMLSDDKTERNTAMVEFNKLQCRILPTQITGADGKDLLPIPIMSNVRAEEEAAKELLNEESNDSANLLIETKDGVHSDNSSEESIQVDEEN